MKIDIPRLIQNQNADMGKLKTSAIEIETRMSIQWIKSLIQ